MAEGKIRAAHRAVVTQNTGLLVDRGEVRANTRTAVTSDPRSNPVVLVVLDPLRGAVGPRICLDNNAVSLANPYQGRRVHW